MKLRAAVLLALLAPACSEEVVPPPPPTRVVFEVRGPAGPVEGARVFVDVPDGDLRTDASGKASTDECIAGCRVRVEAAGFMSHPLARPGGELWAEVASEREKTITMAISLVPRPDAPAAGGTLTGKVRSAGAAVVHQAVYARANQTYVSVTDRADGAYTFAGLPPGRYRIGVDLGGAFESAPVDLTAGATVTVPELVVDGAPLAERAIGGRVGDGPADTRVHLAYATGEWVERAVTAPIAPGDRYELTAPPGRYRVHAFLELDGRTLDPDRASGLEVELESGTSSVTVDLPSAPAVELLGPTETSSAANTRFTYAAFPGAEFYVIEVKNVVGQLLWGGFDARGNPRFRVLDTAIDYGTQIAAVEALTPGQAYRWRVYAGVNTQTGALFRLIGQSEELAGRFVAR